MAEKLKTYGTDGAGNIEAAAFFHGSVTAGITASTTQTQGQGALTKQVNEVATVANLDDTVTLPTAVVGRECTVINNGANTLLIFPFSGDNLGAGLNASEELESNEVVTFVAYDSTNWHVESTTETPHAEFHDEDNTDVFVINDAGGDTHAYHSNGIAAGDLAGWAFDAGGAGTSFPIASVADSVGSSGSQILVTTTGSHGLAVGGIISQTNLANAAYVGVFKVIATAAATTYEVAAVFTATGTGTMDQAATLACGVGFGGAYKVNFFATATSATNNETFDFLLCLDAAAIVGTRSRRKFGTGGDFGSFSVGGIANIAEGEKLSWAVINDDTAGNITVRHLTFVVSRL